MIEVSNDCMLHANEIESFRSLPIIQTEKVSHCIVCLKAQYSFYSSGFDYELNTCGNLWTFVRCHYCAHVWLNPRPAGSTISTIYPNNYYAYSYNKQVKPIANFAKGVLDNLKLGKILAHLSRLPERYLDIGCGNGRYLKALERRGVPVSRLYGHDLANASMQALRSEGYQVFSEMLDESPFLERGTFDLVTLFHVLEHVENPRLVLRQIHSLLTTDGIVAIETPNVRSHDAHRFKSSFWGGYHFPRHWNLFSTETLKQLLETMDFEIIDITHQTGHAFWMYSFHHMFRYGKLNSTWIANRFNPFSGTLALLAFFTLWDKLRSYFGYQTSAVLIIARKSTGIISRQKIE